MIPAHKQEQEVLISTNPARGYEVLGEVAISTEAEIKTKIADARKAQKPWHAMGLEERIEILKTLLNQIETAKSAFAEITSKEMGQPINLSTGMVEAAISNFRWNLENAPQILKPETTFEDGNEINQVIYEPIGVGVCIMAWNFPLPNFMWSVLQALITGNTMVIKYSEEIPLFQQLLEKTAQQSELPDGVLSFVYGDGKVGATLVDQNIDFISFTGSFDTGHALYKKAAEKFIPVVLELGGSSPGVVFKDADLDQAAEQIFAKRFVNCGQFCSDLKRLIVHEDVFSELTEKLVKIAKEKILGDTLSTDTHMGPLVAERQVLKLEDQISDAISKGAKIEYGGSRPDGLTGAFFTPTILSNITKDMKVWNEEVFGPALPIVTFKTYEEAITLANDTEYGLTGFVFSKDRQIIEKALTDIEAGGVSANAGNIFKPQNPFGGYKHSGLGRENGKFGYHDVCQIKIKAWEK